MKNQIINISRKKAFRYMQSLFLYSDQFSKRIEGIRSKYNLNNIQENQEKYYEKKLTSQFYKDIDKVLDSFYLPRFTKETITKYTLFNWMPSFMKAKIKRSVHIDAIEQIEITVPLLINKKSFNGIWNEIKRMREDKRIKKRGNFDIHFGYHNLRKKGKSAKMALDELKKRYKRVGSYGEGNSNKLYKNIAEEIESISLLKPSDFK